MCNIAPSPRNLQDVAPTAGCTGRGGPGVLAYNNQPVHVEYDHQEVLDGKENQHLVEDMVMYHDGEPDHQEGPVLDEQGLHDAPYVRAVFGQEGRLSRALLSLAVRL